VLAECGCNPLPLVEDGAESCRMESQKRKESTLAILLSGPDPAEDPRPLAGPGWRKRAESCRARSHPAPGRSIVDGAPARSRPRCRAFPTRTCREACSRWLFEVTEGSCRAACQGGISSSSRLAVEDADAVGPNQLVPGESVEVASPRLQRRRQGAQRMAPSRSNRNFSRCAI